MNAQWTEEKATILVVEDDGEMHWMIKNLLEREGHSAVVAQSGEEALDMLGLGEPARPEPLVQPDLVLLDVLMEGVDGYQVCQTLKGDERLGYIPVIMVTVLDSLPDKVKGLEYGADDYITKPFRSEELLARIRAQLRVKRLYDERKQAEEALRESEERLSRFMNAAYDYFVIYDKDFRLVEIDEKAVRNYGVPKEDLIGKSLEELAPDSVKTGRLEKYKEVLRTGIPYFVHDLVHDLPELKDRYYDLQVFKVGEGIGIITTDITERKRAEEVVKSQLAEITFYYDNAPIGLAVLDADLRYLRINNLLAEMNGIPAAEHLGKTVKEIVPALEEQARKVVSEIIKTGKPVTDIEFSGETAAQPGVKRVWLEGWYPLKSNGKKIIGFAVIVQEITRRKRAEEELRRSYVKLQRALEGTVDTLVSAIEIRDPYTAGHQRRVTQLACAIANEMGLSEEQTEGIRMAGLIHDVGKISIPAEILNKPGGLNAIEYALIRNHSRIGHDILKAVDFPWPLDQIVLQHHERLDGSGYPQGLSGEEIILEARILGVADVVEAMASHRPYRPAHSIDEALEEISGNRDILYDPEVVDVCLRLFTEDGFELE
jgi:PAS domain S-box-containing protein/putative nucleotidyltransferase with HDIG domain